ncbi:MAG TPA: ABC transporter permease [Spongiibacteraceae bacterium]|nr:ABC transporter permease [Spongiibacteraceae bacterium]
MNIDMIQQFIREKTPAWLFLLLLLGIWEIAVESHWVADYLLPSPRAIVAATIDNWSDISSATLSTLGSIAWGLALSCATGITLAVLFFAIPIVRRAVLPFCVFFQTVPIIAIAPLLVIWFGFGAPTVKASAFIVSLFPILANTLTGLQQTDPLLKELFQLYRPTRWALITKLQLPSALPYILAGMRIGIGLAVIGAIVGEFIAGGGIGSLIDSARTQQRVDLVFSGVLMSSLLPLLLILALDAIARLLMGRRPYLRES